MNEMQRFIVVDPNDLVLVDRRETEPERGELVVVLYSDAEAAIRAAVEVVTERRVAAVGDIAKQVAEASERGRSKGYEEGYWTGAKSGYADGHKDGQRDMLAKCIAAVEALRGYEMPSTYYAERDEYATGWTEHSDEVLAALRAMEEKP